MTKVLFVAAESAPFYKTGGLGDVVYALPQALAKAGVDIRVALPYYARLFPEAYLNQLREVAQFTVQVGGQAKYVGVKQLTLGRCRFILSTIRSTSAATTCMATGTTAGASGSFSWRCWRCCR